MLTDSEIRILLDKLYESLKRYFLYFVYFVGTGVVLAGVWVFAVDRGPVFIEESPAITLAYESISNEKLPNAPSDEEWQVFLERSGIFAEQYSNDIEKYGEVLKWLYIHEEYPVHYKVAEADLTGDGVTELIVSKNPGGSYGVTEYKIIQDNIITTIMPESIGRGAVLYPDPAGNAFSLIWYTQEMFPDGYCCPVGYVQTYFQYKDGVFKPLFERVVYES